MRRHKISSEESNQSESALMRHLKCLKSNLFKYIDQFCKNTTLQGLKYLTDKDLTPLERLFFGVAFITVLLCSGFFILKVLEKWSTTPVIFGTNPFPTVITDEPFPAVTICNLNVAYRSKAEQYSIYSTEYAMLQMLCKREFNVTVADSITSWNHLESFMSEIAQPCSKMLVSCSFGAVKYNCSEIFYPILTDEGLCCAFNMVHPEFIFNNNKRQSTSNRSLTSGGFVGVPWTPEKGYRKNKTLKKYYPRTAAGIGETLGLTVKLDVQSDEYYCSSLNSVGFKLLLHNPVDNPSLREIGCLLSPGTETKALIRTVKYESEQRLRRINHRVRQCLFEDEKKLMIFAKYTRSNCEFECLARFLLKYCGCITYFMPKLYGNESICSIYQSTCVERMRVASMVTAEYNTITCEKRCPTSCYDISYYPTFFSTPLKHFGFEFIDEAIKNLSQRYVEQNIAILHIYHRDYTYQSYKQTEFFGSTDALSSIGGLLAIFFGLSFISFAEFIFFAMIRPLRQLNRRRVKFLVPKNSHGKVGPNVKKKAIKNRWGNALMGTNTSSYF